MIPSPRDGKLIDWIWRSGRDTVGIVAVKTDTGKWRAYIGVAQDSAYEIDDARYIADWGAKLSKKEATVFFPELDQEDFDTE